MAERVRAELSSPFQRDAYALMGGVAINGALGLVYWVLAARLYPTEAVGRGSALLAVVQLVSGFTQLNLGWTLSVYLPRHPDRAASLVASAYGATVAAGIVVSVTLVWVLDGLGRVDGSAFVTGCLLALASVTWSLFTIQDQVLVGLGRSIVVPIENAGFAVAKVVLLVVLVPTQSDWAVAASWVAPALIAVVWVNLGPLRTAIRSGAAAIGGPVAEFDRRRFAQVMGAEYLGAIATQSVNAVLPLVVLARLGPSATAHFSTVWILVVSVDTLAIGAWQSLAVNASAGRSSLGVLARRAAHRVLVIVVPIAIVVAVGAHVLLSLYGAAYAREGTAAMRLCMLAVLPRVAYALALTVCRVRSQAGRVALLQVLLAVGVVGIASGSIGRFGLTGVGIAWLAAHLVMAALTSATSRDLVRAGGYVDVDARLLPHVAS